MSRCCANCRHLQRTSATQRFLLCRYWSGKVRNSGKSQDWMVLHCHIQPEAPACEQFERREHV